MKYKKQTKQNRKKQGSQSINQFPSISRVGVDTKQDWIESIIGL